MRCAIANRPPHGRHLCVSVLAGTRPPRARHHATPAQRSVCTSVPRSLRLFCAPFLIGFRSGPVLVCLSVWGFSFPASSSIQRIATPCTTVPPQSGASRHLVHQGYYCPSGATTYYACPGGYYCPSGTSTYYSCPAVRYSSSCESICSNGAFLPHLCCYFFLGIMHLLTFTVRRRIGLYLLPWRHVPALGH